MQTAVITLQDRPRQQTSLVVSNVWELGNVSVSAEFSDSFGDGWGTMNSLHKFHAVAVDTERKNFYCSDKAHGVIGYLRYMTNNTYKYWHFLAPPISKQVIFVVASLTRFLFYTEYRKMSAI